METRLEPLMKLKYLLFLIGLPIFGCATTTPGAQPHDMSVAQHEAEAQKEEAVAASHAGQHDPRPRSSRTHCRSSSARTSGLPGSEPDVCWSDFTNYTGVHQAATDKARQEAADHRAASAALREAEARACGGISAEDRDMSPFEHTEDIQSVTLLRERVTTGKQPFEQTVGATVTFRAVQEMTVEWLQRVINCHLARNAALGHVVPEMPDCPLVPNGVTATVSSTGNGFAVAIRSTDPASVKEIVARSQRLLSQGGAKVSSRQ